MNEFRERLNINCRRNVDEVIYRELFEGMEGLCKKIKQKDETNGEDMGKEQIAKIEQRMGYLTNAFINFDVTMEKINRFEREENICSQEEKINDDLRKIAEKVETDLCNKFDKDMYKIQVKERIKEIKKIFSNYEEYFRIEKARDHKKMNINSEVIQFERG